MKRPKPEDDHAETQILDDAAGAPSDIDPEKTVVMDKDRYRRPSPDPAVSPEQHRKHDER